MAQNQLRVCIEFGSSLAQSFGVMKKFVEDVNHPSAGILIDLMHLNRILKTGYPNSKVRFFHTSACDFWQSSALKRN